MMAELRDDAVPYPPELAEYDPAAWECWFDWNVARNRWAKDNGWPYKKLVLIQAMTRRPATGVPNKEEA
jgi:hypothetical protein